MNYKETIELCRRAYWISEKTFIEEMRKIIEAENSKKMFVTYQKPQDITLYWNPSDNKLFINNVSEVL